MQNSYIEIKTTFDDFDQAKKFLDLILKTKLIACGQISEINSIYNFENKYCQEKEFLVVMKTRKHLYKKCESFINLNHTYKTPQIVATKLIKGSKDYFDWIDQNTINE